MQQNDSLFDTKEYQLFISFFALIIPFILLIAKHLDDNRLTSWQWVFPQHNPAAILIFLGIAITCAHLLTQYSFYEQKPLFLFAVSFVAGSLFWSEPEVIVDAARYFTQAKYLKLFGAGFFSKQWGKEIFAWSDMPLIPFMYGIIFKVLGEQRIFIQIFNTLLFSGTVALTYSVGKILWDEEMGFYAGLLLLAFPYLYTQVPLMLVDVPTMFFLILAVYLFCRCLAGTSWIWIPLSALSLFCLFTVKYSTWLYLTVFPLIFFIYCDKQSWKKSIMRGSIVALLFLALALFFLFYHRETVTQQLALLIHYQKPGLKRWGESYLSTFFFQIHPFVTLAMCCSLYLAVTKKDLRYITISYLVLLLFFMQVKRIRYTLPLFPFIALMSSYGLGMIETKKLKKTIVFCAVTTSIAIAVGGFLPFLQNMSASNLKKGGAFLDTLDISPVSIMLLPQQEPVLSLKTAIPLLDLYTDKQILYYDSGDPPPNPDRYGTSSLRFTWEFPIPVFYQSPDSSWNLPSALVTVSTRENRQPLPHIEELIRHYQHAKTFDSDSSIFRHTTNITVYY